MSFSMFGPTVYLWPGGHKTLGIPAQSALKRFWLAPMLTGARTHANPKPRQTLMYDTFPDRVKLTYSSRRTINFERTPGSKSANARNGKYAYEKINKKPITAE